MSEDQYPKAFISYSHQDKDTAMKLAKELSANGIDPWIDNWEIKAGDSIVQKIFEEGLRNCSVFIILLSRASVTSPWVKHELDVAIVNRIRLSTQLIPVMIDRCDIPQALRALRWLNLDEGTDYVVKQIVDAAYNRVPDKPLVQPPPDRVKNLLPPRRGLSREATTIAAAIARSLDLSQMSQPSFDGGSLQRALDLTPEQINDAAEELAAHGMVKLLKFLGTHPFSFGLIEPTYALSYAFPDEVQAKFHPEEDIRQVAAAIASNREASGHLLADQLGLPTARINYAVAYLSDYGIIKVYKELGSAPYTFSLAVATGDTRRFVAEQS